MTCFFQFLSQTKITLGSTKLYTIYFYTNLLFSHFYSEFLFSDFSTQTRCLSAHATHEGRQSLPLLHCLLVEAHTWHHVTTLGKAWGGRWMPHCYNTHHNAQPDANPCSAINKGAVEQNHNSGRMWQYAASAQHTAQSSLTRAHRQTTHDFFISQLPVI